MTRYRKSWTEVVEEVRLFEALKPLDKSVVDAFYYRKEKEGKVLSTDGDTLTKMGMGGQQIAKWVGRKVKITAVSDVKSTESILKYMKKSIPSGLFEEVEIEEGTGLQMKMAFDDAKIKVKGVRGGKLVIAKKDKKKATDVLSKSLKKGSNVNKVIDKMIVFEEVELDEKEAAYPATVDTLRKIVKDKQNQIVMFKSGQARVDLFTASAMVKVYDALKPALKKTFEKMITDKGGFMKTQAFAMKMVG